MPRPLRARAPGRIHRGGMDGNGAIAGPPAGCRATGHALRAHQARSANRWGGTGNAAATAGSHNADTPEPAAPPKRSRIRPSAPDHRPRDRLRFLSMCSNRAPSVRRSASASAKANGARSTTRTTTSSSGRLAADTRNASRINLLARFLSTARRKTRLPTTSPRRGFAAAPRQAMAIKGGARRRALGGLNTASKSLRRSRRKLRPKDSRLITRVTRVRPVDAQPAFAGAAKRWTNGRATQPLHRKAIAPLGPPGIQHFPTVLGGHARAKAVAALPLDPAGLVGALHLQPRLAWFTASCGELAPRPRPRLEGGHCAAEASGCQRDQEMK